jgi:Holliday junction DNA helicase RuvA
MIALVSGEVAVRRADHVVVATSGGVGYRLAVSAETLRHVPAIGKPVSLHTHLVVREDALLLHGFATEEERDLFLLLIGVQSVGPKVALAVLSGGPPRELLAALAAGGRRALPGRCPGSASGPRSGSSSSCARRSAPAAAEDPIRITRGEDPHGIAREGLVGLGFTPQEADALLDGAPARPRGAHRLRAQGVAALMDPIRTPGVIAADLVHSAHPTPEDEAERTLRPGRLDEFVGQESVKAQLRVSIVEARLARRGRSITSCSPAPPGSGKTALARMSPTRSGCASSRPPALRGRNADIASFLTALEPKRVFFVDEIHRLPAR